MQGAEAWGPARRRAREPSVAADSAWDSCAEEGHVQSAAGRRRRGGWHGGAGVDHMSRLDSALDTCAEEGRVQSAAGR